MGQGAPIHRGIGLEHWMRLIGEVGFDGWLIADFRWNNPLFARLLDLHSGTLSRRAFLWLPAYGHGDPRVLASRVDGYAVTGLPYPVSLYAGFEEMSALLSGLLPREGRVAMEYVERGTLPTVSRVDGGLIELIRSFGVSVVSSGPLIAALEVWDEWQRALHERAARGVDAARAAALERCRTLLARGEMVTEGLLATVITDTFAAAGLEAGERPDVGVGAHAADPHYGLGDGDGSPIPRDAVLLIDLFTRVRDAVAAPYADSTWMAYTGTTPPEDLQRAFAVVRDARDTALDAISAAVESGQPITGQEIDRVARAAITDAGLADALIHRTGHSLGSDHVHGMGTNLDAIEFPDARVLLPWSGFTVEPGLYWPGRFGVRLEVSAILYPDRVHLTTESQSALTLLGE